MLYKETIFINIIIKFNHFDETRASKFNFIYANYKVKNNIFIQAPIRIQNTIIMLN